jgi:hypothetical protein
MNPYITYIDDIVLIDESLLNETVDKKTNFITHQEFPFQKYDNTNIEYIGNDLPDNTNNIYCIFTFDIFKE